MNPKIIANIGCFASISLEEMEGVALMKRSDTKFVLNENQLVTILEAIKNDYRILEVNDYRVMTYSSLYFDTDVKKFYNEHHSGKIYRTKIRMRKYVESNISFLEIKQKDGKGDTTKSRVNIPAIETNLSENSHSFITKTTLQVYDLIPTIWNDFNRITLVSKTSKERVTIDFNISFEIKESNKLFENLVIVELKQERFNRNSAIVEVLKKLGINPYSISKYCIGMISLYPNLKYNRFKKKVLKINKITA